MQKNGEKTLVPKSTYLIMRDFVVCDVSCQKVDERDLEVLIKDDVKARKGDELDDDSPLWSSITPKPSKDLEA